MNLQSCDQCGVVLDMDKMVFPDSKHYEREDGTFDESMVMWSNGSWRPFVHCPICQNKIMEDEWLWNI